MAPDMSDTMEKRGYAQMALSTLGGKNDLVHQLGLLCFLEASAQGDNPVHPALHALISERRADLAGCTASQSPPSQASLPPASSSIVILSAGTLSGSWATTPQAILALLPPLQPTTQPPAAERMQTLRPSLHPKPASGLPQRGCRVSQVVPPAPSAPMPAAAAAARVCAGAAGQHPPPRGGPSPPSRQTQHHQQPQQQHAAQQQQQAPQQQHHPQQQQQRTQQQRSGTQQQRSTQGFATAGEVKTQQDSRKRPLPRTYAERQSQAPGWGDAGSGGASRGGMPSYARQREVADGGFSMSSAMGPPVWSNGAGGGHGSRDDYDDVRGGTQFPQSANGAHPRVMKKFVVPTRANGGHGGEDGDMGIGRGNGMRRGRDPIPGGAPGSARAMVNRAFAGPVNGGSSGAQAGSGGSPDGDDAELPEELKGCDKALVERITNDIIDRGDPVTFDDIAGLEFAKKTVYELVCWPMKRPDIFTGLRAIPKGLLLFGPPGTGKTLIGKAIASQSGATFFNISASSLTSKWIGEGERMVRTLFMVATYYEPAIIFIDEVDSLLCQRSSDENEATRRLKTEFLVQLDGAGTTSERRVLVIGATNRPQELDEAARRRFIKRLYIPLPEPQARRALIKSLLNKNTHRLTDAEIDDIVRRTAGWSGADLKSLCTEAAMGPIRDLAQDISSIAVNEVPDIMARHFEDALRSTRPSVSEKDLAVLYAWNDEFGTFCTASARRKE